MKIKNITIYNFLGVLCQLSPFPDGICAGDDVTLTCQQDSLTTLWRITSDGVESRCTVVNVVPDDADMCGPMDEFTATAIGDNSTTTLSVQFVDETLNETLVECTGVAAHSQDVCLVGKIMYICMSYMFWLL